MSKIEWTEETWNPVTGCTKLSPGCDNCYMYALYPRLKAMGVAGYEAGPDVVQMHNDRLAKFHDNPPRPPKLVFVNSMADTFHHGVNDNFLLKLFAVMHISAATNGHIFQVLTKRPGRALQFWHAHQPYFRGVGWHKGIWLGTSIEGQRYADGRLGALRHIPAPIRFVSAEPLLGPLDLRPWLGEVVNWVIIGGESGPRARPMAEEWARDLIGQCRDAGVPVFLKQLGGRRDKRGGEKAVIDGRQWQELPVGLASVE